MNEGLALEIAKYKMQELGIGEKYTLRFRHLVQKEKAVLDIALGNDIWILINPSSYTKVSSKGGVFDLTARDLNELQYIHSGTIKLTNLNTTGMNTSKFLQVIPLK